VCVGGREGVREGGSEGGREGWGCLYVLVISRRVSVNKL